jgi:5-methylcytosine-specific restriction protein B
LARKKQLVFYGPPGTGKTYIAEKLAESIVHGGHGFYQTIQFHPSYAYEDFVQGLRPKTRDGRVVYEMAEGVFLRFCKQAEEVKPAPCVFMIDELNRAPLARVLGELLYLLEYRQKAVVLAGGARHFQSPKMFT